MTVGKVLTWCAQELGCPAEARELVCRTLSLKPTELVTRKESLVDDLQLRYIQNAVGRRQKGEPLAYIIQKRGFYGYDFTVSHDTLIPQPDTETLVESALDYALAFGRNQNLNVLDMCTGTGCIGISFAAELYGKGFRKMNLVLSDVSEKALEVAELNSGNLPHEVRRTLVQSDIFNEIAESFDLILSNPPYIASSVIPTLDVQVQAEPRLALDGGEDGLLLIRRIVTEAPSHLNAGGAMFMEIGYDQGESVSSLFRSAGFEDVRVIKDLGGNDRVVFGKRQ